jgi:hypothetical protein
MIEKLMMTASEYEVPVRLRRVTSAEPVARLEMYVV